MDCVPSGTEYAGDLMTRLKEEIVPAEGTTIDVDELVHRLQSRVNVHLSPEECCLILGHLTNAPIDPTAISRHEVSLLFDSLDNRIAIRVLFEKYSVPILNEMGPDELKLFFEKEQEKSKSSRYCRHLIDNVNQQMYGQCCSHKLTLNGFYRVLALDMFRLFNPVHDKPCQSMDYPLTHYYVATSRHISYPAAEEDRLRRQYPEIHKLRPSLSIEKWTILAKYRDLLFTGYRCLQVKLIWSIETFCIPIQVADNIEVHLELDDFLAEVYWSAFKKDNPYPVILQFISKHLTGRVDLLYQRVSTKFQASLYKPLPKLAKFPSVKSLQSKFLVYYFSVDGTEGSLRVGHLLTGDSAMKLPQNDPISLGELHDDRYKASFWECFSAERGPVLSQIKQSVDLEETERNQWPTITERNLIAVHADEEEMSAEEQTLAVVNFIRVGVQMIAISPESIVAKSLFRLNGGCGYVAKPIYLRKGGLYKRFAEDKLLKDELPSWVFKFALRIICTSPLEMTHFAGGMNTSVTLRIIGHEKDEEHHFQTKVCSNPGLVPFWNEQTRFWIRVPDLAFFKFEVWNNAWHSNGQLIGYHVIPVKAVLKGNRHVQLFGRDHQPIVGAKLFFHIDFKKITTGWKPAAPEKAPPADEPKETVSIPL